MQRNTLRELSGTTVLPSRAVRTPDPNTGAHELSHFLRGDFNLSCGGLSRCPQRQARSLSQMLTGKTRTNPTIRNRHRARAVAQPLPTTNQQAKARSTSHSANSASYSASCSLLQRSESRRTNTASLCLAASCQRAPRCPHMLYRGRLFFTIRRDPAWAFQATTPLLPQATAGSRFWRGWWVPNRETKMWCE